MSEKNSAVAVYDNHAAAERAVEELHRSGFDMKKVSIVGNDYHTDEKTLIRTGNDRITLHLETPLASAATH